MVSERIHVALEHRKVGTPVWITESDNSNAGNADCEIEAMTFKQIQAKL